MKRISVILTLIAFSVAATAKDMDSLRRVIKGMHFAIPVLSPVPSMVSGVEKPVISLNGTWEFYPSGDASGKASPIEVPGEWMMQGFTVDKGKAALYRRSFTMPGDWKGKRIKIRFDGVSSHGDVRVNGIKAGSHEGSFAAFEFDITKLVKPGENLLEVAVECETISDILACTSQYAAHPVGGILRKVTLYALPETNISDFSYEVKFDSGYKDAILNISAFIQVPSGNKKRNVLQLGLKGPDGKIVEIAPSKIDVASGKNSVQGQISVKAPAKWEPEHPNLYVLTASLISDGKTLQTFSRKIGFRQVELRGNLFVINNRPVKFRGVDRHEVHPLRGRSLTPELCRQDVELFRAGNCNYIRTSHYPPSEEFLEACDELGMFVESESSLCWIEHGASPIWKTWNYLDTTWLRHMVRANQDNILTGRMHPSIVIWSLGNESRWSPLWERVHEEVKKLDTSRPTSFHDQCWGNFNNAKSRADIANYHYPGMNGPRECEKEKARPTLFGEYMHVQCYARRELETDPTVRSDAWAFSLKDMVDSVYAYPACMGGAIWSGVDDIFHLSQEKICGYGPWGPIDGWRRKKPEFTGMMKSYSPVVIKKYSVDNAKGKIRIDVENRYNFTNLSELNIEVSSGGKTTTAKADIEPLSKGSFYADLPGGQASGEIMLTFTDPRGFICCEEALNKEPVIAMTGIAGKPVSFNETTGSFIIKTANAIYAIDRKTGSVACTTLSGESIIEDGGRIMLVPFNNDTGGAPHIANNGFTQDITPLDYLPEEFIASSVISEAGNEGTRTVVVTGRSGKIEGSIRYVFNSEYAEVSYDLTAIADFKGTSRLRQYGILFTLPGSFDNLSWKRTGMWSVYPDYDINRLEGSAQARPRNLKYVVQPREVPSGPWKDDANRLGTNDFRSAKDNILFASLKDRTGKGVTIKSDGTQHSRSWTDKGRIYLLVTSLNAPGSCPFFTGPRPEFKAGDHLKGKFILSGNEK